MLQPVSVGLKFGFLVVLYLFLLWVALERPAGPAPRPRRRRSNPTTPLQRRDRHVRRAPQGSRDLDGFEPRLLVERAAGHETGIAYDLMDGATLGRGDVEIRLDDPFASSRHARISREGHVFVIEDLGSTNGTYLNEEPIERPAAAARRRPDPDRRLRILVPAMTYRTHP